MRLDAARALDDCGDLPFISTQKPRRRASREHKDALNTHFHVNLSVFAPSKLFSPHKRECSNSAALAFRAITV